MEHDVYPSQTHVELERELPNKKVALNLEVEMGTGTAPCSSVPVSPPSQ